MRSRVEGLPPCCMKRSVKRDISQLLERQDMSDQTGCHLARREDRRKKGDSERED